MLKGILFFDNLITPKILTIIYWILLVVIVIGALFAIINGNFFHAIAGLILGCLGIRISFELVMIAFKNNEYLKIIAEKTQNSSSN